MADDPFIPYGRQWVDEEDIQAVCSVLRSDLLTTGPMVEAFERGIKEVTDVSDAVAVSSGTAALHCVMHALDIGPGDEVIVPAITFAATANAVVYQGGTPVFADVDPETILIDPDSVRNNLSGNTRAVVAVDYAGQCCDYDILQQIARKNGITLVSDACHSLGGTYKGVKAGNVSDISAFSFHPVKHITTGEGGMVVTGSSVMAEKVRVFRNHGIDTDYKTRSEEGSWYYEIDRPGFNYRITDIQCALGLSQLQKLEGWIERRNQLANQYDHLLEEIRGVTPLVRKEYGVHAYHLYVVLIDREIVQRDRKEIFSRLREMGIGVNVHYIPVYFHPFYRKKFGYSKGLCPVAEDAYERMLTLPLFPQMTANDVRRVCACLQEAIQ